MNPTLLLAIITITFALVFYTIGVFSERHAQTLKPVHLLFFGLGLVCDTTGTALMSRLVGAQAASGIALHQITGGAALLLMLAHFLWAAYVLWRGTDKAKSNFHRFSIVVWAFWLIPYFIGLVIGMSH